MDKRRRTTSPANATVTVTTVSKERLKTWRNLRIAMPVLAIGSVAAMMWIGPHHEETPAWIKAIDLTVFFIAVIFSIALKVMKAHKETGKIIFRKDSVSIQMKTGTIDVALEELRAIHFQYKGYEGENYYDSKSTTSFHTGLENYIQITTDRFDAGDEILLVSRAQVNYLEKRLEEYTAHGIKISSNARELPHQTLLKIAKDYLSPF